jgi:UTP-glucose-1-phosphate uridylyltransferase
MPRKFLAEMVMDRIAACKVYRGSRYDDGAALDYLQHSIERELLHDKTRRELVYLLTMLKEKGEKETFDYIKNHILQGKPFPWEETEE